MKCKIFDHLLKITSDHSSYLLKVMINLLIHSKYSILENQTNSFSICADCADKIVCQKIILNITAFLESHFGNLTNSLDPDQPPSEEAG